MSDRDREQEENTNELAMRCMSQGYCNPMQILSNSMWIRAISRCMVYWFTTGEFRRYSATKPGVLPEMEMWCLLAISYKNKKEASIFHEAEGNIQS